MARYLSNGAYRRLETALVAAMLADVDSLETFYRQQISAPSNTSDYLTWSAEARLAELLAWKELFVRSWGISQGEN